MSKGSLPIWSTSAGLISILMTDLKFIGLMWMESVLSHKMNATFIIVLWMKVLKFAKRMILTFMM